MDFAVLKAMLAMDEITKAYAAGLDEAGLKAFVAKTADEQKAEAHAAAKKLSDKTAEEEAAKKAREATETETAKSLREANDRIAQLEADRAKSVREREIEKEAGSAEFDGYPGGTEAVKAMLLSIEKVDDASRKTIVDSMKAQAAMAKRVAGTEFGGRTEEEMSKAKPKTAAFNKKLAEVMSEKSMTRADATKFIAEDPALKGLYNDALSEA